MPRDVPTTIKPNLLAGQTEEAYIALLDIHHANGTIYLCNNSVALSLAANTWSTVTGGNWKTGAGDNWIGGGTGVTYQPFPFTLTLPDEIEGQTSTANITVDNCSREIVDEVRLQEEKLIITMRIVQASTMETLAEFVDFQARDVRYSGTSLSLALTVENFVQERFPGMLFSKKDFRGLFP